jgi:hypothetical protein
MHYIKRYKSYPVLLIICSLKKVPYNESGRRRNKISEVKILLEKHNKN